MHRPRLISVLATTLLALAGCGGGSDGAQQTPPSTPPPPSITKAEAFRFLNQATFGATEVEASRLIDAGYEAWIDEQMTRPVSSQLAYLQSLPPPPLFQDFLLQPDRVDAWFRYAITGDDQLRQRVAFALSEIMVVSQLGVLVDAPWALADYYDTLAGHAFGNYRDLLEAVTLHPAMGVYLSMLGNEKPNPDLNIRPDENYARELMQLFSIGLVELNADGTAVLGPDGQPVPTYDQSIIEGFAHVFTGWHFAGAPSFEQAYPNRQNQVLPMQLYPDYHDTGSKKLLRGTVLPAGQTGLQDLNAALDNIFEHPNVGPFIAIRLIQRLVTSNPSPAYVERVAAVFDDNGRGVRGDLGAVVRAILLDTEARSAASSSSAGKLKEPLLRFTQLYRAFNGASQTGKYRPLNLANEFFGQGPLQSPSVFNFFSPFYAPPGEIRDAGLVAPELEIATEYQNTQVTNYFFYQVFLLNWLADTSGDFPDEDTVLIEFQAEADAAADADALVEQVAGKLLGGEISDTLRQEVTAIVASIPVEDSVVRAAEAIYLIAASPEFAYQP